MCVCVNGEQQELTLNREYEASMKQVMVNTCWDLLRYGCNTNNLPFVTTKSCVEDGNTIL